MSNRTNQNIAHLWASGNVESGKTSNGTMYFEGRTIYSYGSHYPIARMFSSCNVVLFNSASSSVTTEGKHKNRVRQAIPHDYRTFAVPNVHFDDNLKAKHLENWKYLVGQYESTLEEAKRAIKTSRKDGRLVCADQFRQDANEYRRIFKITGRGVKILEPIKGLDERLDELRKESRKRELEETKAKAAKQADDLARWKRGEFIPSGFYYSGDVQLRLITDIHQPSKQTVQTSRGAEFPLTDAIKAYKHLKRLASSGKDFHRNGESIQLGPFQIDSTSWEEGEVRAGCHRVKWEVIKAFAVEIGVDLPTTDNAVSLYGKG